MSNRDTVRLLNPLHRHPEASTPKLNDIVMPHGRKLRSDNSHILPFLAACFCDDLLGWWS